MSSILHMSDFHFGKELEAEKKRLYDLAMWIKESSLQIDCIVFTGDMIDGPTVQSECVRKLKKEFPDLFKGLKLSDDSDTIISAVQTAGAECISFYNTHLRSIAVNHMKQAGEILAHFIDTIGIESQNVVLCCGNHDRLRFADEPEFLCENDHHFIESSMAEPFVAYDTLCASINSKLSHNTMKYVVNDICFLIVNTNWRTPVQKESNNMCVSCDELYEQLFQIRQADSFNRNQCLLVAHKPFDDFCEMAKYPYSGETQTIQQIIDRTVTAFLYGDKHSYIAREKREPKEYMCGSPLSSCGVRYNLLDLKPDIGICSCSYILNDEHGWVLVPITDCVEAVYSVSRAHLKEFAIKLLANTNSIPLEWESAAKLFQKAYKTERLSSISKLYSSFCDLRQEQQINIDEDSFFDQLISLIEKSNSQSIGVKGRPGVGKSTFMTLLYLNMLWSFSNGKTRYLPFYFNFENVTSNLEKKDESLFNVEDFVSFSVHKFTEFLNCCINSRGKNRLPICLLIDGLEKSKSLSTSDNTIEKQIFELVETLLNRDTDKYVMCFNTHDSYHFDQSFDSINRFEYVLFMNRIRIIPYKSNENKIDIFLSQYLTLLCRKTSDTDSLNSIKNALVKFRSSSIDMFFMYHFNKHIEKIIGDETIWSVLRMHLENLESITKSMFGFRINIAQEAAGLLFSQRKRYCELNEDNNPENLSIQEFFAIINRPCITNFLIAKNYTHLLSIYSNTKESIPEDSILFSFIPNDVSILIRLLLDEKGAASVEMLARFVDYHANELRGFLYSTVAYLCGHLRTDENSFLTEKLPLPDRESNEFFSLCGRRSYDLAKAVCSNEKFPVKQIVKELMDNEYYRRFNRSYQLHYYQDASNNAIRNQSAWSTGKAPSGGFDFRNSFLLLLSKLEPAILWSKPYPLMELDLFTVCDLIYSRLQHTVSGSLFYTAKYNDKDDSKCEAIISKTICLLNAYNKLYGGKRSTDERIGAYFSLMEKRLTGIQKNISKNVGKNVDAPYVSHSYDYEQILKVSSIARVGWNIDFAGTIKTDNQPTYTNDPETGVSSPPLRESVMQHVMETLFIAQLFLPESLSVDGYQKSKVITLLLLSELGKTVSGDYTPHYSNLHTFKSVEEEGLSHILTLGALDGYAKQSVFLKPLSEMTFNDINLQICRDIKMIQMEYKYYSLYHQLGFSDDRRVEFESDFEEPTTEVCRRIRELLVSNNPYFRGLIKS